MTDAQALNLVVGVGFACMCGLIALLFNSFKKSFEDKFGSIWKVINEVKSEVKEVEKENKDLVKNYKQEFKEVRDDIGGVKIQAKGIESAQNSTNNYLKSIIDLALEVIKNKKT